MKARDMQIEFERRIQLIDPSFISVNKLTSDTIFSFLNAYCERFVRNNYLQEDILQDGTRQLKKNADALKGLVTRQTLTIATKDSYNTDKTSDRAILPDNYFLYIRSNSIISKNYKIDVEIPLESNYVITKNKTIREDDVDKIISTYYNKPILRNPYIVLSNGNEADSTREVYINVIHDEYTIIKKLDLVYYRKPKRFDIIGVDSITVFDECELPENVHMEIVEGAVEMFITEAKYRLNMNQNNNK